MVKYFKYLKYLFRHKWHVFQECYRYGLYWRGIIHDSSKFFRFSEFLAYTEFWFGVDAGNIDDPKFLLACLEHHNKNKHHWHYWVLIKSGKMICLPMPDKDRKEMLCDWRGCGMAKGLGDNTTEWYLKNKQKIKLHPETRKWVEKELGLKY